MAKLARVQRIVLPILQACPDLNGVAVKTWFEDIDYRQLPMITIKRMGGKRHEQRPTEFGRMVIEMSAYGTTDLPTTETMYDNALEALYEAVDRQTQTEFGYLHSMKETTGMTLFDSPFPDSWRVQGLIQLGVRPPRA